MSSTSIMAVFSALALGHSLFLARHFWTPVKKNPSNFFLALFLTAFAIRILKSVIVILIPNSPFAVPAIGLVGLSAIGPSLWLYLKSYRNTDFSFENGYLWHYAWALFLIPIIPFLGEEQMYIAYCISVAHMLSYLVMSTMLMKKNLKRYSGIERTWLRLLMVSSYLIWLTFFAQLLIEEFVTYLLVTIVASVVIYGLSLWAGKKRKLFVEPTRRFSNDIQASLETIAKRIEILLGEEKVFKDPKLSIKSLSQLVSEPEYMVSQAVNSYFKKSFPELLNQYRIEHATFLINSDVVEQLSMGGIAEESGYNSLSAFYRAFKKIKGVTPAKYKA